MTDAPLTLHCTLLIPRPLSDACGSPAQVKSHLLALGVWPERVQEERWRGSPVTLGYEVELDINVPLPSEAQGGTP